MVTRAMLLKLMVEWLEQQMPGLQDPSHVAEVRAPRPWLAPATSHMQQAHTYSMFERMGALLSARP
jgi:hypothetical protein